MYQEILNSSLRIFMAYFLLLFLARIMGRKMISQMTFFDFVVGVIVGTVAGSIAVNSNKPIISGITVLIVLALITVTLDFSNIKSFLFRKITNSEPVVIIERGRIIPKNMKKTRLTLNDLMMLMREKNAFNISDVEYALFETNGKLSVLKKSQKQPATPSDLNIPTTYKGLTKDIIIDGKIMYENLKTSKIDEKWLLSNLKAYNIKKAEEVFYAGIDTSRNLYVSSKTRTKESEGQHGIE